MTDYTEEIKKAAKIIKECNAMIFLSGAGMGVDSGLPDFRGKEGFWKAYPPMQKLGLEFSQMSTPSWFEKDPKFAWGFWSHRYNLYTEKKPHEGYHILKRFSEGRKYGHFVFTSNVDGHNAQVFGEEKVYECHGSVLHWQCSDEKCKQPIYEMKDAKLKCNEEFRNEDPPKCPTCGKVARPNVLMFGDFKFRDEREDKYYRKYMSWINSLIEAKDNDVKLCCIEIGAGLAIPTVREQSEKRVKRFNGSLIRINIRDPEIPKYIAENSVTLPIGGKEALMRIEEELKKLN